MSYMTYSQLKVSAKAHIKPATGSLVGAAAITIGFNLFVRFFFRFPYLSLIKSFAVRLILSYLVLMLSNIFLDMLKTGLRYLALKVYSEQSVSAGDIFYAFSHQTKEFFLLSAFISLVIVVPMMPYNILSNWYLSSFHFMPATLRLFTYVPATILTTILRLHYAQAYFLLLDFPSYSVKQALKESRLLMRGHKKRFFLIQLRLLLVAVIGFICTLGIGTLWILPFIHTINGTFYLDLITKQRKENI